MENLLIRGEDITAALTPRVGPVLARNMAAPCAALLRAFEPGEDPAAALSLLSKHLQENMFGAVYALLGPKLLMRAPDGQLLKFQMSALEDMADDVLGVLYEAIPVTPEWYALLRHYALDDGSLRALWTLCHRYAAFLPPDEALWMRRALRGRLGPACPDWLKGMDS